VKRDIVRQSRDMDEEFVTHAALVEHLRRFGRKVWCFFTRRPVKNAPSGFIENRKVFCPGGTRLQRMGMLKGVPDLVILHSGRIMGLEVKSPGGTLSREQKEFRVEWERAGGIYALVRSVEEGRALLEAWGMVTASGRCRGSTVNNHER
jgi:hypothetical protein